jgi:hypothetical protein
MDTSAMVLLDSQKHEAIIFCMLHDVIVLIFQHSLHNNSLAIPIFKGAEEIKFPISESIAVKLISNYRNHSFLTKLLIK